MPTKLPTYNKTTARMMPPAIVHMGEKNSMPKIHSIDYRKPERG